MSFLHMKSWQSGALGLDFDGNVLVLSELKSRSSGAFQDYHAKRVVCRYLQQGGFWLDDGQAEMLRKSLLQIVKDNKWRGRKVVLSAPSDHLLLRHLSLPSMPKQSLKMAIHTELKYSMQLPFDDPVYDYALSAHDHVMIRNDGEQDVIVMALPKDEVMHISDIVRSCGLRPIRMEPVLLAAQRMLSMDAVRTGIYAIFMLRTYGVELGVFDENDLVFLRQVRMLPSDYGLQLDTPWEEQQLLGYASDLSHEVERSFNFVHYNVLATDFRIENLYVFGNTVYKEEIILALQSRLEQTVHTVTPPLVIGDTCIVDGMRQEDNELDMVLHRGATAIGLALSEAL
ncbi:type IV pilus biogenesis protein PilM [Sulfoacidibacillus ferrooxidans]|uniref:Pilus assembly protein PilM n=1 Tax=Sulfoacidibacillus ferrooxidans TaxID=2005001 RepID=A0A9X2ACH7_9BACL|nr:hypothetical protein [Sulfoacidibacillus ferrooxidans]MCI0183789.1 hypothetical protein [Sulfoacidibacillus ferrooxidans]